MGVRVDGIDKFMYNHFDSYPSGLGADIVDDINELLDTPGLGLGGIKTLAQKLELVDRDSKPTPEQQKKFIKYFDSGVASRSTNDWYCLLREMQGKFAETLQAGVAIDYTDFIKESLFCEWAYVVNFDTNMFEVYKGFQERPHTNGRYSSMTVSEEAPSKRFYPCALVAEFPLTEIPKDWHKRVSKDYE